ncbi:putative phage Mu G virion morphogenesis protein [Burkholderia aenigmatica]|uniref:Putative phage Mu G virion morphogenesis protein n=1 Tax=Burkholderia aenigmatica TaxID=2015348 RepID=A0A6P2SN99_9BURK|nr:phage virion morphogenesis protein [Burkholderia aenigmatica]MDN8053830.1 phage virion morphogenesis protein [Burkholderia multivorans]VWC47118.1 putative phage Mu G virion morphogenesis protein [Burkholderia aenigmatica]
MSDFVSITVDDSQLQAALQRLEHAGVDLSPAMRKIAQALHKVTEDNFAAEGRPKWTPLAEATKHARLGGKKTYKKNGELTAAAQRRQDAGFRILQHTGDLAGNISTDYDSTQAVVGSNKEYAAIHQFGGMAGRGRKVEIPARPYLPLTTDGDLQPEAREEVLDTILRHLKRAAGV